MAQEYYDAANNLEKKTAVLGKIARDLERLIEMKTTGHWNSVKNRYEITPSALVAMFS
jgi:hypothetical protein